jgi:hypothetical protein
MTEKISFLEALKLITVGPVFDRQDIKDVEGWRTEHLRTREDETDIELEIDGTGGDNPQNLGS